jgi:hypothetical protein
MNKNLIMFISLGLLISPMACMQTSNPTVGYGGNRMNYPSSTPTNLNGYTSTPTATFVATAAFISGWVAEAPNGIAFGNSYIYVAEGDAQSVSQLQVFNPTGGSPVTQWSGYGSTNFQIPTGIAVVPSTASVNEGNLIVLDDNDTNSNGGTIYELTMSGAPVTSWTSYGNTPFGLSNANGWYGSIGTDSNGNVYLADYLNNELEVFTSAGVTVMEWNGSNGGTAFDGPGAVALDSSNNVYVADVGNELIQVFTSSGTFKSSWPTLSDADIFGLTVDSNGNVYAADYNWDKGGQVEEYNSSGTLISIMNGNGGVPFSGPTGVLWQGGDIYVADFNHDNIQVF